MAANIKNEAQELNLKIWRPKASTMEEMISIAKILEECIAKEEYLPSSKRNNATMVAKLLVPQISYTVTGVARSVPSL